jgi:hypothetical protein
MASALSAHRRARPGSRGGGRFFHVEVRPSNQFVAFRVQDVGAPGGVERVAGRRASGSLDTAKWLVGKSRAHVEDGQLFADSLEAAQEKGAGRGAQAQEEGGCRMIRKLPKGGYRLYSRKKNPKTGKRRNLGTFKTRKQAEQHERQVQYFKRQ